MTASSRLAEVRQWLTYAREDLRFAESIVAGGGGGLPRHACEMAEQAAEKTIKAALIFAGLVPARTHSLDDLRAALPAGWAVKTQPQNLSVLSEWAVRARYPGNQPDATSGDARLAVQQAQEVWNLVAADLLTRGFDVSVELP